MNLIKLKLNEDKTLEFQQHRNFKDSVSALFKLDNGYVASIITKKYDAENNGSDDSAQGSLDDETFELGILNKHLIFVKLEELNDDSTYSVHGGVWPFLSKDQLIQKLEMISNLKGE